jgi:hypothetical protein
MVMASQERKRFLADLKVSAIIATAVIAIVPMTLKR